MWKTRQQKKARWAVATAATDNDTTIMKSLGSIEEYLKDQQNIDVYDFYYNVGRFLHKQINVISIASNSGTCGFRLAHILCYMFPLTHQHYCGEIEFCTLLHNNDIVSSYQVLFQYLTGREDRNFIIPSKLWKCIPRYIFVEDEPSVVVTTEHNIIEENVWQINLNTASKHFILPPLSGLELSNAMKEKAFQIYRIETQRQIQILHTTLFQQPSYYLITSTSSSSKAKNKNKQRLLDSPSDCLFSIKDLIYIIVEYIIVCL